MSGHQVTVVVLAKRPRPGAVKTRLCPPCTPEEAAALAAAALRDTLAHVRGAAVAARVLTTGAAHAGRSYALTGPRAWLPRDQVAVLASALGRPLRFEPQPDDEARLALSRSTPPAFVDAFFRFFVDGEFDDATVLPAVEQLLGRPPRSFEQWVHEHVERFRLPR